MPGEGRSPLVELVDIVKSFPGVTANDGVSLAISAGEVHGLLGENGAGKTTLMSVLSGLYQHDGGTIRVSGREVSIASPANALAHGIAIVQQHFALVPTLTVAENVVLGAEPAALLSRRRLYAAVAELAARYGLDLDPGAVVAELSVGERQRVEILKALYRDPKVLILDEPTTVLTSPEVERLLATVRSLADESRCIVLITHKLDELLTVSDRITVLRSGRTVATVRTADVDPPTLARLMVGRDVELRPVAAFVGLDEERGDTRHHWRSQRERGAEAPVLSVVDVSARDVHGATRLDNLSLEVHAHEILGVAGVEGNGQRELVEVLAGTRHPVKGRVVVAGHDVTWAGPIALTQQGVRVITEDRHATGLVLDMTLAENLVTDRVWRAPWSRWGVINPRAVRTTAEELMEQFGIRAPGPDVAARALSGGNQQRAVLARELSGDMRVLVASQPTRGLDVGAIEDVTGRIIAARDAGVGVLLISSDLDEILALADRVAVLYSGRILDVLERDDIDLDVLGLLMGGVVSEAG